MEINKEAADWAAANKDKTLEEAFIAGFIRHGEFAENVRLKKEEKINKLKKDFYNELIPYVPLYGKEVIREFYDHFCQANASRTNIGRYMSKTWDTSLRLKNWVRRANSTPFFKADAKSEQPTRKLRELN
jgi:hypothetical protein